MRASAKNARKVREQYEKAKEEGKIAENAPMSVETLEDMGLELTIPFGQFKFFKGYLKKMGTKLGLVRSEE